MKLPVIVGAILVSLIAVPVFSQALSNGEVINKVKAGTVAFYDQAPMFVPGDAESPLLASTLRPSPVRLQHLPDVSTARIHPGMTLNEFFKEIPVLKFRRERLSGNLTVRRLIAQKKLVSAPTLLKENPETIEIENGIKVRKPWVYSVACQYFEVDKSKLPQSVILKKELSATDIEIDELLKQLRVLQIVCSGAVPNEVSSFTEYHGIEFGRYIPYKFSALFVMDQALHQHVLGYIVFTFDDSLHSTIPGYSSGRMGIPNGPVNMTDLIKDLNLSFTSDATSLISAPEVYVGGREAGGNYGQIIVNARGKGKVTAGAWEDETTVFRAEGYEGDFIARPGVTGAFGRELSLYYYKKSFPAMYKNLQDAAVVINSTWVLDEDYTEPKLISRVEPKFPAAVRTMKLQLNAVLDLLVLKDGTVAEARLKNPNFGFVPVGTTQALTEAVRQWKFEPAKRNGAPVDARTTIETTFKP